MGRTIHVARYLNTICSILLNTGQQKYHYLLTRNYNNVDREDVATYGKDMDDSQFVGKLRVSRITSHHCNTSLFPGDTYPVAAWLSFTRSSSIYTKHLYQRKYILYHITK